MASFGELASKILPAFKQATQNISQSTSSAAQRQGGLAGTFVSGLYKMGQKSKSVDITPDGVRNLDGQSLMNKTMVDELNKKKTLLGM